MDDYISRQAAIDALGERPMVWTSDDDYSLGERNQYDIDRLAIETVASAERHGKWLHKNSTFKNRWLCSECGYTWYFDTAQANYCPYCGARMDGE